MRTSLLAAALLLALAGGSAVRAASCPPALAEQADAAVDTVKTWADVGTVHRRFAACDDGSIAEGYADAIAGILVKDWRTLPQLNAMSRQNPGLKRFVLRHVNSTLDTDQLNIIARLSRTACPRGEAALCRSLASAARTAER